MICHGRPGRMSPGLVMAGTGGSPGSPRCWTYEPGFIPGRDQTEAAMKNSQLAGSQDDRAGTARMRRWWTGEKLSVRLSLVAFVLVLTGALVWAGWFASASQNATWTPVLVTHRRRRRSCLCEAAVSDVTIPLTGSAGLRQAFPDHDRDGKPVWAGDAVGWAVRSSRGSGRAGPLRGGWRRRAWRLRRRGSCGLCRGSGPRVWRFHRRGRRLPRVPGRRLRGG